MSSKLYESLYYIAAPYDDRINVFYHLFTLIAVCRLHMPRLSPCPQSNMNNHHYYLLYNSNA
eukprot:scaffold119986_cov31-Prasinocladus_malaysianus.AAC.1